MNEAFYALLDTVQKTAVRAGGAASSLAYLAGKKSDELLSAAKLNLKIVEKRGEVEDLYKALGKILYATHTGEGSPTDSDLLLEKLQEIDTLKAEIAELEVRAGHAEKVRTCPVCGGELREGDAFCRECGAKL